MSGDAARPLAGEPVDGAAPIGAPDPWATLRRHTPARLALGRAGASLPTDELLRFAAAHARARDAVHVPLDVAMLAAELQAAGWPSLVVTSRAPNRDAYLRRPDWGRRLAAESAERLEALVGNLPRRPGLAIVLGDGLSAVALQRHALPVLQALHAALDAGATTAPHGAAHRAPLVIATQARVALADEVGRLLGAELVLILLGERPGLSSPDSLGAYLTHSPHIGCHDAQRNCVSNIRPEGLPPQLAAARLAWLIREAQRRRITGIGLKDESTLALLARR